MRHLSVTLKATEHTKQYRNCSIECRFMSFMKKKHKINLTSNIHNYYWLIQKRRKNRQNERRKKQNDNENKRCDVMNRN